MATTYSWKMAGHGRQRRILERAASAGRSHAFLFYGPPGIGKRRLTLRFAEILRCRSNSIRPCFACSACRMAERDIDTLRMEPLSASGHISIDQMRAFTARLHTKGFGGSVRIGLIFGAHRMQASASNAFLKHLEEPAPDVCFLLVADTISRMPATILSRCTILKFNPYSEREMIDELSSHASGHAAVAQAAAISNGRVEFARSLLDGGLSGFTGERTQAEALLTLPLGEQMAHVEEFLKKAAQKETGDADKKPAQELIDHVEALLRGAITATVRRGASASAGSRTADEPLTHRFSPMQAARVLRALKDLRYTLERNGNARLAWEHFLLRTHGTST